MPRYVGNTMAVFVMQSLGCEVAALNTVQFSISAREHPPSSRRNLTVMRVSQAITKPTSRSKAQ